MALMSVNSKRTISPYVMMMFRQPNVSSSDVFRMTNGDPKIGPITAHPVAAPSLRRNQREMSTGHVTAWLIPEVPMEMTKTAR